MIKISIRAYVPFLRRLSKTRHASNHRATLFQRATNSLTDFHGRVLLLMAVLYLFHAGPLMAQGQPSDVPVLKQNMKHVFREAKKFSLIAGGGITLMDSDYEAGKVGLIEKIKINGYGYSGSVGGMYQFTPYVGGLLSLDYISVRGKRPQEGCSFCSEMVTTSLSGVMLLATRASLARLYSKSFRRGIILVPYLRGGVGFMSYQASSYNDEQSADPATEYPDLTLVVPLGGGLRLRLTDQISLATEAVLTMPFSDYLDNRPSGNNLLKTNDQLLSFSLKGLYHLGHKRSQAVSGSLLKKRGFKKKK